MRGEGAHPRSRGEHVSDGESDPWHVGSSPLARGTQTVSAQQVDQAGLIPARAGNTISHASPGSSRWAHPRSRGEHLDLIFLALTLWGSSPLARGTHFLTRHDTQPNPKNYSASTRIYIGNE